MGFLETCAALLAFITIGVAVSYFSGGGRKTPPPDVFTPDDLDGLANTHYAKSGDLSSYGITDKE